MNTSPIDFEPKEPRCSLTQVWIAMALITSGLGVLNWIVHPTIHVATWFVLAVLSLIAGAALYQRPE